MTYNQQATIARTLESIAAQERDFPIEVVIGEDGSTDGTRSVCEEFAARHPCMRLMPAAPNKGIVRNWLDCLGECCGEYVAACAGDDFWHDPHKLRMQVDFLDANPGYGVVHTDMLHLDVRTGMVTPRKPRKRPDGRVTERVYLKSVVLAPTACFRRELARHIDREEWLARGFMMEDLPMWIEFARHTLFKFLPLRTVTYSVGGVSVSTGGEVEKRLRFLDNTFEVLFYFYDKYRPGFPRKKLVSKYRRNLFRIRNHF
jgi:glycosyltransferase involved in cell wall biosynthesis